MSSATLTTRGRLTIPKQVRKALGLQPGDQIEFIESDRLVLPRFDIKVRKGKAKRKASTR